MVTASIVKDQLLALIESGSIETDGRLPTERALTEKFGTTRWAIRRALNELEAEGRVWRHVGRGTYAGGRPPIDVEVFPVLTGHTRPSELIEARMTIEPTLTSLAATRATQAQIEEIKLAERKCASARNMEVYEVWDERLHRTIAEAANNLVLTSIFEGLNAIRKKIVWGHMKKAILRPQRRQFYSAHHKKIVAAIIDRDADSARRAMAEHLQQVEAIYLRIERAGLGSNNPIGL